MGPLATQLPPPPTQQIGARRAARFPVKRCALNVIQAGSQARYGQKAAPSSSAGGDLREWSSGIGASPPALVGTL